MSNSWCKFLSNGLRLTAWPNRRYSVSPCCYIGKEITTDNPDYLNQMKQLRNTSECNGCLPSVQNDENSPYLWRTKSFKDIIGQFDDDVIVYAEVSLDNRCNAACLQCGDYFSTTWEEQNKKFHIKKADDYPDPFDAIDVVSDVFNLFDFSKLQILNFLGGEPMMSDSTRFFLSRLIEMGIASQVTVNITSNGSIAPDVEMFKILKHFKLCNFNFSIDDIGERFEYVRYPLAWNKIVNSLSRYQSLDLNLSFGINATICVFSAFYLLEHKAWVKDFFMNDKRFTGLKYMASGGNIAFGYLDRRASAYLIEKYKDHPEILALFRFCNASATSLNYSELLSYVDFWDKNRNLSWQTAFPRSAEYILA